MEGSSERLPWLTDEPPRKAASAAARPAPGGKAMWPWYLLLLLVVAAVGAGAWWLGTRQQEAPPPELPAEQSIPITVKRPPEDAITAEQEAEAAANMTMAEPAVTPAPLAERPRLRVPEPRRPTVRSRPPQEAAPSRGVFPADEPIAVPPPAAAPVVLVNPRPYSGRVVQLGAFPSRAQAEASWRRVTTRYPYLATKPKMVNTVDVRAMGGGRPTRMYRLQLGTSSQAQSVVICQQLERAGQSCVVVY